MLTLNNQIFSNIKSHALENINEECCGLLVNNNILKTNNVSLNKNRSFTIHPLEYLWAENKGKIKGFYHSHCNESDLFSERDIKNSEINNLPLLMYHIKSDNFKLYDKNNKYNQYIGIKFKYNKSDCLSMVENFYKNEFNIKLPTKNRNINWFSDNPTIIEENISNYGFKKIELPLKFGDVILSNTDENINPRHMAIYLGNNLILHNTINSYSRIEEYNELHKKYTIYIVRHESQC